MKIIFKVFISVIFLLSFLGAKEFCIIAVSTKVINTSEKNTFLKRFPSGAVKFDKKYYIFRLKPFNTYNQAEVMLLKVKIYYKKAFIVNCGKVAVVKTVSSVHIKSKVNVSGVVPLIEPFLATNKYHLPITYSKISNIDNTPVLSEPKILKPYEIPRLSKTTKTEIYDTLSFKRYIDSLFEYNDKSEEASYQKKIDYILSDIKKDQYNFDVYVNGYIRTGSDISTGTQNNLTGTNQTNNSQYTNTGVALNANKRLYDGQYRLLTHTYDILNKRLADIKEINAKDKLAIIGASIYTNMFLSQQQLKFFRKILKRQKYVEKTIEEGFSKGKNSILDYIDAKKDLLNLQLSIVNLKYLYLDNDYIMRHSIKARSEKPYKLLPVKIKLNIDSLALLQKEAINNSSDIAIESNILKIKKTDLFSQKRRYQPEIDFNSYLGYALSKDSVFSFGGNSGAFWGMGLSFKIPLYNRNDIRLNIEKETYSVLQQKRVFSSKIRDILIQVDQSYNKIVRLGKQTKIIKELVALTSKKIIVAQERYFNGISEYRDYSEAIKSFLEYKNQLIQIEQNYNKELYILSILVGKRDFYGQ